MDSTIYHTPENFQQIDINKNDNESTPPQQSTIPPTMSAPDTSMLDVDPISPNAMNQDDVLINVPFFCINAEMEDNTEELTTIHPDEAIMPNLRAINYDTLSELTTLALSIATLKHEHQIDLYNKFLSVILTKCEQPNNLKMIMDFLKFATDISRKMDIDDDYLDIDTNCITFDVIRHYKNDPITNILVSAEAITLPNSNIQLYSQIENADEIMTVRQQYNDSDYNRIQYCLSCFEKTLMFRPGYIYNRTSKFSNLALFYLCLYCNSRPIDKMCSNDLKGNILSYMIDLIIRSRVIQVWQRQPSSKKLLADMVKNYNSNNHIVQLCQLKTARLRAQYFIKELARDPKMSEYMHLIKYDSYYNMLEKYKITMNDHRQYYILGSSFMINVITLPDIQVFKRLFDEHVRNDENSNFDFDSL